MTQAMAFEPGARYLFHKNGYQVMQILDDGTLVARNLTTNALLTHQISTLRQAWLEKTLEFAREGPNLQERAGTALKTTYVFGDLANLPPNLQGITWHRYQLIHPLVPLSSRQRTQKVVEERIQTYLLWLEQKDIQGKDAFLASLKKEDPQSPTQALSSDVLISTPHEATSDHHPFSPNDNEQKQPVPEAAPSAQHQLTPRTVSRWIQRFRESHGDIRSLVPSYHQRGPQDPFLNPRLEALLQQALRQTYLTNRRAPVTHVITTFHTLTLAENASHPEAEPLPLPGKMIVYRYIQQLDGKEVDRARKGPRQAERDHHQFQLGPLTTRPNQRVEFDFAQLHMLVVDATDRLPIGRPTIAAIRDKYTGYILGIFISFDPPPYRLVMECMLYAFLPKDHVKALFRTQHEYLAYGIPEVLVVDNGIELHRDLELACLQLGIELQHMPVRTPGSKVVSNAGSAPSIPI